MQRKEIMNMSKEQTKNHDRQNRAKRVKRLKRLLVIGFLTVTLLPIILCIVLMIKIHYLEQQVAVLYEAYAVREETARTSEEKLEPVMAEIDHILSQPAEVSKIEIEEETETTEETEEAQTDVEELYNIEADDGIRKIYLTFDDGPSNYTDEILNILKEEDVKATFFVTGKEGPEYERLYKRIVDEGHTLGMHSYSHKYYELYASKESFTEDLHKLQDYLEEVTGVRPVLYRFPGGSSNSVSRVPIRELADCLEAEGIRYFDWNISSGDASGQKLSVDTLVYNCTKDITQYSRAMILMHDAADKRRTVEALPIIIDKLKNLENTAILPVTDETEVIQHIKSHTENK